MFGLTWDADTFVAKVYIDGSLVAAEKIQNDDPDTVLLSVKNTTSNPPPLFFKYMDMYNIIAF